MAVALPVIKIRGAACRFDEHLVFTGIDLDVYPGEVLTVLGPNGCGKSSLLRCMGGALRLSQGTVHFNDVDVSTLDATARARKVGILFQDHTPSFPFTVLDVVIMGRTPYLGRFGAPSPKDAALAEEALDKVGMRDLKEKPYTEVSGGERQLVLLARTLVQQPEVILLDEPTAHLDFKNQTLSLKAIAALAAQGLTMVMTTHDPNHAFLLPGRVAMMQPGGAIIVGRASELITEAALSATYGIGISVLSVPARASSGEFRFCSPWYS